MKKLVLILVLGILIPHVALGQRVPADLVLFNGKVFTADPVHRNAQAIAIRGQRIIAVGTNAEVSVLAGPTTRRINLQGRVVIPGINDAHYHHTPDPPGHNLQFKSMVRKDQLLVHCSGDKPVEVLFNAMDQLGPQNDWPKMRVRIEHGDGVIGDLIPRARRLGVVVVQNPSHFTFTEIVQSRFGPDMPFFPLRSLVDAKIPVALGSDGPLNPYLNIMFAVIHPTRPTEALTREQAVEAYTLGSAFAEYAEQEKGSIKKGKLADIAVLSQDIFTVPVGELPKTASVLTIIGGKVVYDAGVLK